MSYTPAPWAIFNTGSINMIVPAMRDGMIADMIDNDANAYLIRASPDLLDALVGLVGLVELIIPTLEGSQKSAVQHNHRLDAARAAIEKATTVTS